MEGVRGVEMMWMIVELIMFFILQWNARSLIANGQELKRFVAAFKDRPALICVQETWLKPTLSFVLPGYVCLRKDRNVVGGGCAVFIREEIQHRRINVKTDLECVAVEVWSVSGRFTLINFYNPCSQLEVNKLDDVMDQVRNPVIWTGDFNAHNPLWGSKSKDKNGAVLEDFFDNHSLVMLNDGRATRFQVGSGKLSCLDLTFASAELARCGEWDLMDCYTMGSDHFPILSRFGRELKVEEGGGVERLDYCKADWDRFRQELFVGLGEVCSEGNVEEWSRSFCYTVSKAVQKSVPVKRSRKERRIVPWWNKTCNEAVRARNIAYRQLRKSPVEEHVIVYKRLRARARRVIKEAKKESWRKFCGTIGVETTVGQLWGMVHKMTGINRSRTMPVLVQGEVESVSCKEKANLLVKTYQRVHSSNNVSREGQLRRGQMLEQEGYKLRANTDNNDVFNVFFSMQELKRAIGRGRNTTPGRDGLGYEVFKQMDDMALGELLALMNTVWQEGIPAEWKHAVVVPILKPGKEASSPDSYRPIALTAVMCKVMERMVTDRLVYYLERQDYFAPHQSGFRLGRGTMDAVLGLDRDIKRALVNREVVVAVFLDIERAYDMLWKEGLVLKLYDAGIRGRMLNWIREFLVDRTIQVKVGGVLSDTVAVDNGTPQGSVISPVLFNIMVNDMLDDVGVGFGRSLFADDGAVWKKGRNVDHVMREMQRALDRVQGWADKWGFRLSVDKSKYVVFGRKKQIGNQGLKLYNEQLEKVKVFKFLGIWMDERLTYRAHVEKIGVRCEKVINVMRCLTGCTWGADRNTMMMIYRAMVRSIIDYGCLAYGSAAKTTLAKLDVVQARALRVCTGAFPTTPISALLVEAGEAPLRLRRDKLTLNYWVKVKGFTSAIPSKELQTECWEFSKGQSRLNRRPCMEEISNYIEKLGFKKAEVAPTVCWSPVPQWLWVEADLDMEIKELICRGAIGNVMEGVERHLESKWGGYSRIYTDGSRNPDSKRVGFGMYVPDVNLCQSRRLTDGTSIFSAELVALLWALWWVEEGGWKDVVICTDSLSALMALGGAEGGVARKDITGEILINIMNLERRGFNIGFVWVPAHVGVYGNERADQLAKESLDRDVVDLRVPLGKMECRSLIHEEIQRQWQKEWEEDCRGRKLYNIQPSVQSRTRVPLSRQYDIKVTRLRLGHCALAGGLALVGKHQDGRCQNCGEVETVKHVMLHCPEYAAQRRELFKALEAKGVKTFSLPTLLGDGVKQQECAEELIKFLLSTGLYHRI